MTDTARRAALDYLAALNDREAADFTAEARHAANEVRDFARALFRDPDEHAGRDARALGLTPRRPANDPTEGTN